MAQAPTFSELKDRLHEKYECDLRTFANGTNYFERQIDGQVLTYPVDNYQDNDRVALWVVKSICRRLKVDLSEFHLKMD